MTLPIDDPRIQRAWSLLMMAPMVPGKLPMWVWYADQLEPEQRANLLAGFQRAVATAFGQEEVE